MPTEACNTVWAFLRIASGKGGHIATGPPWKQAFCVAMPRKTVKEERRNLQYREDFKSPFRVSVKEQTRCASWPMANKANGNGLQRPTIVVN